MPCAGFPLVEKLIGSRWLVRLEAAIQMSHMADHINVPIIRKSYINRFLLNNYLAHLYFYMFET